MNRQNYLTGKIKKTKWCTHDGCINNDFARRADPNSDDGKCSFHEVKIKNDVLDERIRQTGMFGSSWGVDIFVSQVTPSAIPNSDIMNSSVTR